mmetsp:Transcript_28720/g.60919  ORF Transcript_28720/g.60919 Transcript_28720/m.60919 type:complete len:301 (-) Transcript_28720:517-1419(-)
MGAAYPSAMMVTFPRNRPSPPPMEPNFIPKADEREEGRSKDSVTEHRPRSRGRYPNFPRLGTAYGKDGTSSSPNSERAMNAFRLASAKALTSISPAPSMSMSSMSSAAALSSSARFRARRPAILDVSASLTVVRPPTPYAARSTSPDAIAIRSSILLLSASMLRSPSELFEMYSSVGSSWLNTGSSIARFESRKLSAAMQSNRVSLHPSMSVAGNVSSSSIRSCSRRNTGLRTGSISSRHFSTASHRFTFTNGTHFLVRAMAAFRRSARSCRWSFRCRASCCCWMYGTLLLLRRLKYPLS